MEKTPEEEKQLILRIIKYVRIHHRVTLQQIIDELKLDPTDQEFLVSTLSRKQGQGDNPNHVVAFVSRPNSNNYNLPKENEYQLLPTALFSYIDYLEIVEARKAAGDARKLSLTAIEIAVWSLVLSTLVGLFSVFVQVILK